MKTLVSLLLLSSLSTSAFAAKKDVPEPCKISYSLLEKDTLGNVTQGAANNKTKWLQGDLEKKYPSVCYALPDPSVRTILFITVAPSTYNGTRIVNTTATTTGNVSGNDGSTANYNGTTSSSTAVPYSFAYGKYLLTVETLDADHKVTVRHRFQQDGIYSTLYGIPLGGRGHHPEKALIEDAVKWLQGGGLENPLQSAQ